MNRYCPQKLHSSSFRMENWKLRQLEFAVVVVAAAAVCHCDWEKQLQ